MSSCLDLAVFVVPYVFTENKLKKTQVNIIIFSSF